MFSLILCLLLETDGEAKAKALLTLAAAAAQAKPAPDTTFFERLPILPRETRPSQAIPAPSPTRTLEQAAAEAARLRQPLIVWVNHADAELKAQLGDCIHVHVETYRLSAEAGVVACPLHQGWPHSRRLIPAREATQDTVTRELSGEWLREKISERQLPQRYLFSSPRAAGC